MRAWLAWYRRRHRHDWRQGNRTLTGWTLYHCACGAREIA